MTAIEAPDPSSKRGSTALKLCIFATGFSGIVAEYAMSTLASYLLGDAVVQWTLTISLMLFAMGLGSRASKNIENNLLEAFILAELALSLLTASSALLVYFLVAFVQPIGPIIYGIALAIGFLIGLEMPLATRINERFENLRLNISSIMEKDYYGALLGGLLFAFVALPYLGLTYTPIILGLINLAAASVLYSKFREQIRWRRILLPAFAIVPVLLVLLAWFAEPILFFGEQRQYKDKIVHAEQSPYQRIVLTRWKQDHWLYLNGNLQFSSYDEARYHESLVHPAMALVPHAKDVLILGGGDGLAAREVLKYAQVETITLVDLDPAVTQLGLTHPVLKALNQGSLEHPKLTVVNQDAMRFIQDTGRLFDLILIDLPDPKSVDLARLYALDFYQSVSSQLSRGGVMVTQATSPFFSRNAFLSILKTVGATGYPTFAYQTHIPTMGQWAWVLQFKDTNTSTEALKNKLSATDFSHLETRYLNRSAMTGMLQFGKDTMAPFADIKVNSFQSLSLVQYYQRGAWDFY